MIENKYAVMEEDNQEYVELETNGKYKVKVKVDKDLWFSHLKGFSWTAIKKGNRIEVKTSINKQSKLLHRVIIEYIYDELEYWGSTIDHKNNDNLDNRVKNLQIYNTALLNTTNINSKYKNDDMQYIYALKRKYSDGRKVVYGYKVHYNIGGTTYYKCFRNIDDARAYRNSVVYNHRETELGRLLKKCRDIEFERGLKEKLNASEFDEVKSIMDKYNIIVTLKSHI